MRYSLLRILILAMMVTALSTDGLCRDLIIPSRFPPGPCYARVTTHIEVAGRTTLDRNVRVWFKDEDTYRMHNLLTATKARPPDVWIYGVRNGRWSYCTTVNPRKTVRPQWECYPYTPSRHADGVRIALSRNWAIAGARLIGKETMHGLAVEHWRGLTKGKARRTIEVWLSTDRRFPLPLKVEVTSATARSKWAVEELDITTPIPSYVFTPQTEPRPGLLNILKLPYKTPPWAIVWEILTLLSYVCILIGMTTAPIVANRAIKGLILVTGGAALTLVLLHGMIPDMYFYDLHGSPVMLAYVVLAALFTITVWRVPGRPGDMAIFRGTTPWVIGLMLVAALWSGSREYLASLHMAKGLGISKLSLPVLPMAMLNIALFNISSVTIQEIVFRGYILQSLTDRMKSVRWAVAIQAILFGLYHLPARLQLDISVVRLIVLILGFCAYGVLFAVLRLRYRNIGVPWLVHFATNMAALYIYYAAKVGILTTVDHQ